MTQKDNAPERELRECPFCGSTNITNVPGPDEFEKYPRLVLWCCNLIITRNSVLSGKEENQKLIDSFNTRMM